jgi:hypothetical protein
MLEEEFNKPAALEARDNGQEEHNGYDHDK